MEAYPPAEPGAALIIATADDGQAIVRIPRRLRRDSRSLAGGAPQPLQFGLERGVRPFGVVSVG